MPTPDENETNASDGPSGGFLPTAGVSTKLKVIVIGLTFITITAFGIFTALFIKKAFIKGQDSGVWGPQLMTIAEELKGRGLKTQAIGHYKKYLDTQKVDLETRSRVSFDIATLYVELGNCDDAVVWFLHSKVAQPNATRVSKIENEIQQCRSRSKISP